MADQFQGIESGKAELKDYYDVGSQYEAIKRRRKKAMEKQGLFDDEKYDWDRVPTPSPNYTKE